MFEALLARVAVALADASLPYMVIGGQAVLLYGEPRLTRDVDVTLGADPARLADLLAVCDRLGLVPVADPEAFVAETLVLPCDDPTTGLRVDFIFSYEGFERSAIDRAATVRVGGVAVRFASVEDLVVLKVVAGRPRDLDDVRGVLVRHPALDAGYVRRWLAEFDAALGLGAQADLDRLLRDADGAQPSA